ncbi:MAG TPA: ABC transporter permease subunit [Candidatus Dormibacteraeota bacterium]|jgi:ABC-2 type transport system permease protein
MSTLAVLLRKELREQWRTLRLPIAVVVFFCLGVGSPLLARYTPEIVRSLASPELAKVIPEPRLADAIVQFVKNMGQIGALMAIVLAMGSVATERERGTAAFVLSKSATRFQFLAAKLLALAVTLAASVAVAGLAAYAYTAALFAALAPGFAVTCALILVALLVIATVTFTVSTVTGSTVAAGAVGFVALIAGGMLSILPRVDPYTPFGMVARAQPLATGGPAEALAWPLATQALLICALFALALLVFRRQEL